MEQKLRQLKLSRIGEVYADWVRYAEEQQLGYAEFLDELVSEEVIGRQERQMQRRYKAAGFPYAATLEQFDFSQRPELKRSVMMRYVDSRFVEQSGALILIGASGLGKTHLAIAVGTKMVQLGYGVRFVTAQYVANQVLAAPDQATRTRFVQGLIRCDVLIVDEFGYLPMDVQVGPTWYEIVAGRYERGATVMTSNKNLPTWGEVIGGESALMMAILDRLLHHGDVFYLRGSSYRLRGKAPVSVESTEKKEPVSVELPEKADITKVNQT